MPTTLSPLHEALFQAWAKANGVTNHDDPSNSFDHRALFQNTGGLVQPRGAVNAMADAHNKAAESNQGPSKVDISNPDPYAAAAEIHKANLDSQGKHRSDLLKVQLEREKMHHKSQLESMKLQHKSMEADKDRSHKAQVEQHHMMQAAHDRAQDRQFAMEDAARSRQEAMQDHAMNRQHALEDAVRTRSEHVQDQTAKMSPLHQQLLNRNLG